MNTAPQTFLNSLMLIVGIALLFLALSSISQTTTSASCLDPAPPCPGNPPAELVNVFCRADADCNPTCSNPTGLCCREAEYICGDSSQFIWSRCYITPCTY